MPPPSALLGFWWEIHSHLKNIIPFALPSWFLMRDPRSIETVHLIIMFHFWLTAFNPLSFIFRSLIMLYLDMEYSMSFSPPRFEFLEFLEFVGLCLSQNVGDFQQLSLQIYFWSPFLFFSSPSGTPITWKFDFLVFLHWPLRLFLCFFSQYFFTQLFILDNFYW